MEDEEEAAAAAEEAFLTPNPGDDNGDDGGAAAEEEPDLPGGGGGGGGPAEEEEPGDADNAMELPSFLSQPQLSAMTSQVCTPAKRKPFSMLARVLKGFLFHSFS